MQRSPRSVEAIVEQQVQRWNQERARGAPPRPRPVILVSRQFGARGSEIARQVAERLGFAFWDQELLHEIARHAHVSDQLVAAFDEHHQVPLAETVRSMMHSGPLGSSEYFTALTRAVRSIAAGGSAVLVGRGAQFLLDPSAALRVRAVATVEARARGLCERNRWSDAEARARIAEVDADRRAFARDYYDRDVDDPTAYDLMINTAHVPLDRAAQLVIAAYEARFGEVRALLTA